MNSQTSNDLGDEVMKAPPTKRPRLDHAEMEVERYSIESMLAVPMEIVFRQVSQSPQQEARPLLTRAEADCLLKVAFLAQELDVLMAMAEETLSQQRYCRLYRKRITRCSHPLLRPMIPILTLLERQPKPTLRQVQENLGRLVSDLSACATALRQSADQNWTLSDSLIDALDGLSDSMSGRSLAQEKRKLAELEEEVCQRIEKLVAMANDHPSQNMLQHDTDAIDTCRILFHEDQNDENLTRKESDLASQDLQPIGDLCSNLFPNQESHSEVVDDQPPDKHLQGFADNEDIYPTRTQPEHPDTRTACADDDGVDPHGEDEETLPSPLAEESQNSLRKKSSAAEALAVLALGKPVLKSSTSTVT